MIIGDVKVKPIDNSFYDVAFTYSIVDDSFGELSGYLKHRVMVDWQLKLISVIDAYEKLANFDSMVNILTLYCIKSNYIEEWFGDMKNREKLVPYEKYRASVNKLRQEMMLLL